MKLFSAVIEHKHGSNFYIDLTHAGLRNQVADFCRDWWATEVRDAVIPESDDEVIERYFDATGEHETWSSDEIDLPYTPEAILAHIIGALESTAPSIEVIEPGHFLATFAAPGRIEVTGQGPLVAYAYAGTAPDLEQEPSASYDSDDEDEDAQEKEGETNNWTVGDRVYIRPLGERGEIEAIGGCGDDGFAVAKVRSDDTEELVEVSCDELGTEEG